MKPLALVKFILNLGCVYSVFPIMPSLAGSVPVGASSGVTLPNPVGTPVISPPRPAPSITTPPPAPAVTVPSTTPNVTTPPTGTSPSEPASTPVVQPSRSNISVVVVTPSTQVRLNQTATRTFTELQVTASTMARIVVSPNSSNLTSPVSGIILNYSNNSKLPSDTNDPSGVVTESNKETTPIQVGLTTAMQVKSGNGVNITSNSVKVNIPPVSLVSNRTQVSTNVTITTANNENLNLILTGTSEQVSNAAGFVAMGASAEFSLDQIKTGTSIALTGTEFGQVGTLINNIAGLFDSVPQSGDSNLTNAVTVSPEQLNTAILTFNQIVDDSNDETIVILSRNSEFLTIGDVLKSLRGAITTPEMP